MKLSPEERQRRSDLMRRMHAEGKIDPVASGKKGGRPRKVRASEKMAELAASEAQTFFDRMMEIIRHGSDTNARAAIMDLMKLEEQEREIESEEESRVDQLKRDELISLVAQQLEGLRAAGILPDVVDGEFVEIENDRPPGVGAITERASEAS